MMIDTCQAQETSIQKLLRQQSENPKMTQDYVNVERNGALVEILKTTCFSTSFNMPSFVLRGMPIIFIIKKEANIEWSQLCQL